MNRSRVILLVVTDLLIIGELFIAMYAAHVHRERFNFVFLTVFFGSLIPTLVIYFLLRARTQRTR